MADGSSDPTPWSPLHAAVLAAARQRGLLPRGAHVLVAVSGGQDSLCLAQLLLDLAPVLGLRLTVAHCDHRMRPDSAACAAYVRGWAAARGLAYLEAVATAPLRSEAQARDWRYGALASLAAEAGCCRVATGHTASDRAETLLLNAIRGSGADGLSAMVWRRPLAGNRKSSGSSGSSGSRGSSSSSSSGTSSGVELVRPLLSITRQQTGEECLRRGLEPWHDSTNDDPRFARNALRRRALPELEAINPAASEHLASLAEALAADVECLEAAARAALSGARREAVGCGGSTPRQAIDRARLRGEHLALQRRALRAWLREALGSAATFEQVEEARQLLGAPNRSRGSSLRRGVWLEVEGPLLVVRSDSDGGSGSGGSGAVEPAQGP
ncbi:hypothetical protein Rsub_04714 [Raphidocelis subcapitata]|uniref:tRNA(Ile)-lysidine synthetase n=1 Tax=Raphidocelis subcapitata TaxID=307507 RepID=A0A2V0P2B9_9CHLO|nr:hypothetical protein Rsub_04714 [Raphidocelis subcapitata]|eukprot:GBF91990.1 hypothetical protein Rsub_04714 [Raphidocelis subcapitata]